MSQFTVCRSWDGYCLLLDDDRIAGGKPDYHESNVFYEWRTRDTYGPVDELQAENEKLRELVHDMFLSGMFWFDHFSDTRRYRDRIRELGIEVDA